jgi:diguanylate cyclase (GGDEF)-like protein
MLASAPLTPGDRVTSITRGRPTARADRPARILIVDDSEDDAFLVSREIGRAFQGAEFVRVDTPEDMARELRAADWDLVIADHRMPRFDSAGALTVLKASGRDIPFVIYSGQLETDAGVTAMNHGASDFVAKSTPGRLLAVVHRELEHARLMRAKERAEQSVVRLANYDALTQLPNRSLFIDLVQLRLGEHTPQSPQAALLFLDLDRFMRINDSFGYPTGDALIRQVALRLQAASNVSDVVARLGQDEFALFIDAVDSPTAAQAAAQTIMQRFAAAFVQGGQEFFLTASGGLTLFPDHGADVEGLLRNAESAVFEAKRRGRNNVQLYRAEMTNGSGRRLKLENDLRHAVDREELFVAYQPVVDLRTHAIIGTEALVRWRHPELGVVPPDQFIGIADESGLIIGIGEWVLGTACRQTQAWRERFGQELFVAVNFSAAQFRDESMPDRIAQVLEESHLPARALEIEITETVAMEHAESTIRVLHALKRMGVRISIDDFGTGYSSLAYLKRFPIDILKIDKSFVRDIREDADDAAIVRTIAALGRSLKLLVHAEGVEAEEQASFLEREGCDRMQGYWIAKPLEAADMERRLDGGDRLATAAR